MKWKYYVAVIYDRKLSYVTEVNYQDKSAQWKCGERAKPMGMTKAQDLVFGLVCNGYPATVLKMPEFMEPANVVKGACENDYQ